MDKSSNFLIVLLLWILFTGVSFAKPDSHATEAQPFPAVPLQQGDQILFLGDSITQAGLYAAFIQTWLWSQYPEFQFDLINLGLNGETASGNSEEDHPYPRAHIHERIDRVLKNTDPDLVFICYGMNDGIYHPFSEKRFADYRNGITRLINKLAKPGRKIVLLSPPPFDLFTFRQGHPVAPENAPADFAFSYKVPSQQYDLVLEKYSEWIMQQKPKVTVTVNLHAPLARLIRQRRDTDPDYKFGDGIHPPVEGHLEMALCILDSLGADRKQAEILLKQLTGIRLLPSGNDAPQSPTALWNDIQKRHRLLTVAWIEHVGHMKPNKAKTPSLPEAREQADALELKIRSSLTENDHKE